MNRYTQPRIALYCVTVSAEPRRLSLRQTGSAVGILIGIAGVVFVARTLVSRWDEVTAAFESVDAKVIAGSLALGLASKVVIAGAWTSMIRSRGHDRQSTAQTMSWFFTGQLGKYVPGAIWPIVGRAEMAVRSGVPRQDAYASTGLSLVATYLGAAITISAGSLVSGQRRALGVTIGLGLVAGWAAFASRPVRTRVLAVLARVTSNVTTLTDPGRLARLAVIHVPAWVLTSLSTSVTASAFGARIGLFEMLFVTSASWFAGFVVVGAPGGIGVREAVFTTLAASIVGTPVAVSIAISSRVVFIAVDLIGALAASILARGTRSEPRDPVEC